jgi:pimeloyl-ACP methyl ester carboxylesterase
LADLRIDATGVRAEELVWQYYKRLAEHLASSHEVIPFAYDWRLSLESEAARLAGELDKVLQQTEKTDQPVNILAHGMGGLLARAVIAGHPDVWERLCRHPQGRLVMLGAPLGGSWAIPLVLTGRDSLVKQLALLDMKHDCSQLLDVFSEYPGLLEMLPEPLFDRAVWERLKAADSDRSWPLPTTVALDKARRVRVRIEFSPLDPDRVCYVAGVLPTHLWG